MKLLDISALAFALFLPIALHGQTSLTPEGRFAEVLQRVTEGNTALRAVRGGLSADELENSAVAAMPDPEAEVTYAKGSPKGVPARTNVSFTQTLDWGVLTGRRRAVARAANSAAAARYLVERQKVMAEADEQLTRLVFSNKLCAEVRLRLQTATALSELYEKKFAQGDVNQMELNKVRLNAAVAKADAERAEAERQSIALALHRLAGGDDVAYADTVYPQSAASLPAVLALQSALAGSSEAKAAEAAVKENEAVARLARSQTWPALTVGFQGEYVKDNNYNGLSLGFSVPLWGSGRREYKAAQARIAASRLEAADVRFGQSAQLAERHRTALALAETAETLRRDLSATSNAALLSRALEEGQISLLDYLLETSFYYSARTAQLEAERDAQLALSALRAMFY